MPYACMLPLTLEILHDRLTSERVLDHARVLELLESVKVRRYLHNSSVFRQSIITYAVMSCNQC